MILKHLIALFLVLITANSVSICPSGSITYEDINLLGDDLLDFKSQNSDVFYRITYNSGDLNLNCYKILDQSSNPNPAL